MKREILSSQNIKSSSLHKFSQRIFCALSLVLFFTLTSCNNIGSVSSRLPSSEVLLSNPSSGSGGGAFTLTGIYASQQSPGTMFDVAGNNSQFDTYCTGTTNGPCACEYTYVSPGIGTVTSQGAVSYQESNLLRCLNTVPSGISSFEIRVIATGSGTPSNTLTANLNSGGFVNTNYIDLSKEQAYSQVKKFQCRKREYIENPMSGGMIDPIQSEDPKIVYPFNFYTTNVASSLWNLQQLPTQDWDCTLSPTFDRSLQWWANPNVYSASTCTASFCAGDGEIMAPQNDLVSGKIPVTNLLANGKRRASFSLAKQSYGVFQVKVKAAVGPSSYTSSNYDTIGYGARPIPSASGSSACPSITLPSNAVWVKLWNFRATDITPPKFVTGSTAINTGQIACNSQPGIFPSCDNPSAGGAMANEHTVWNAISLSTLTSSPPAITFFPPPASVPGNYPAGPQLSPGAFWPQPSAIGFGPGSNTIASRVVGNGNLNACYNISAMGNGQEAWDPSPFAFTGISLAGIQGLPWGVYAQSASMGTCGTAVNWVDHTAGGMNNAGCFNRMMEDEPSDTLLTTATLNLDNYSDQMFVVTDPAVDDTMMRNQALAVSHYKPVTYRTSSDCTGPNRAGCPLGKEIHWDINVKDVGVPGGPDQFPICVLQFFD